MLAMKLIKKHEGLSLKPYQCTAGKTTIGYGRNLDDIGISQEEAETMLRSDVSECITHLCKFDWWFDLNIARQAVLIDMCYNLGITRLKRFVKMIAALNAGDYFEAAHQMIESNWALQVHGRAVTLSNIMRDGESL